MAKPNNIETDMIMNDEYYNQDFKWYILYVMSGFENRLKQKISELTKIKKFEKRLNNILVPIAKKIIVEQNKKKERIECVFTSYIFIQANLDDELYNRISNFEGVFYFLGSSKDMEKTLPLSMNNEDIDLLFNAISKFKETDNYLYLQFAVGDYVKITSGVFRNCRGRIKVIHNNKVTISSEYLSAADIKEIPIHTIEKIDIDSEY